ncbi:MAG: hypothetical protein M3O02_02970 [Acidobacteriota bacterium]|nr:hypothetical protein [Acidobacteriota bacterium]
MLTTAFILALFPAAYDAAGQGPGRSLRQREVPCQSVYAQAVQTIGLARWSAPEAERPAIERLLNAAAKAKELVDSSFLQWEAPLCSADTLTRLHTSIGRLQANRWLPETPEEQREAEAAAANAELLKAMDAGFDSVPTASVSTPDRSRIQSEAQGRSLSN